MEEIVAAVSNPSTTNEALVKSLQAFLRENLRVFSTYVALAHSSPFCVSRASVCASSLFFFTESHTFVEKYGENNKVSMFKALLTTLADSKWNNDGAQLEFARPNIASRLTQT